jgi:regulator of protease activity HflC (stomatin/prohibitin superfamily)
MANASQFPKGITPFKLRGAGMKRSRLRFLVYLAVAFIVLLIIFNMTFVYVHPGEFAIKQVNIGVSRGVQQKVYNAGLIFRKPFGMELIHQFPKTLLVYELSNYPDVERSKHPEYYASDKAAHIQTSDGFFVDVDCTILYRISDPYKVLTMIGAGRMYESNGIIPKTEPVLKQALGQLTTEEFYISPLRYAKTQIAEQMLREQLEPKGIKVEQVLVRYFQYSEEIQKNIEEKKLKDQLVFKNQAEARAATEEANLKRTIQEGEANYQVKLQEGQAYVTEKTADIDLYKRTRHAEADLLVKLADAKKTELKNQALRAIGSDRMVGLKMAEVLKGLETIILPSDGPGGLNPLNLRQSLKLFEVSEKGEQQ